MKEFFKNRFKGKWWYQHKENHFMESIISITARISDHLPNQLQKLFINSVDTLGLWFSRLINVFSSFFSSYYIYTGSIKNTEKNIQFIYKGNPDSLVFFTNQLFKKNYSTKKISQKKVKHLLKKNKGNSEQNVDFIIIKTDVFFRRYYQKKDYLVFPEYITFLLDASQPVEKILSSASIDVKQHIDNAKKTGYSYEIRDDKEIFKLFYYQMYLPYTSWKHKGSQRIASFSTIRHLEDRGAKILLIKHHESYIFGGIFLKENGKMTTYYAGLMKGKFSHLHNGVMTLSYYYLINIAKKYNCKFIDFGTARPFLNDGLYTFKNKWNMDIVQTSSFFSDVFAMKIIKNSSTIENFITIHPIHYFKNNQLTVLH